MSEEPVRLREGASEVVLRRDLAGAHVREPSYDVAAGAARFEAAIAGGVPLPPDPAVVGASGGGIVGWGVGTVLAVAVVAVAVTRPWREPEPIATATTDTPPRDEPPAPPRGAVIVPEPPAPAVTVDTIPPGPSAEAPTPDVDAPRSPRARARRAPDVAASTVPATSGPNPRDELVATRAAASALASDPARALALVERTDREFAEGMFAEDRRGIAALAELRLGRADARAHASAYLRAHPKGTYAERLRKALGEPPQTP